MVCRRVPIRGPILRHGNLEIFLIEELVGWRERNKRNEGGPPHLFGTPFDCDGIFDDANAACELALLLGNKVGAVDLGATIGRLDVRLYRVLNRDPGQTARGKCEDWEDGSLWAYLGSAATRESCIC